MCVIDWYIYFLISIYGFNTANNAANPLFTLLTLTPQTRCPTASPVLLLPLLLRRVSKRLLLPSMPLLLPLLLQQLLFWPPPRLLCNLLRLLRHRHREKVPSARQIVITEVLSENSNQKNGPNPPPQPPFPSSAPKVYLPAARRKRG